MHSHWGTKRGYAFQDMEQLERQSHSFNSIARYVSEQEMAQHLQSHGVAAILDLLYTNELDIPEVAAAHDYAFSVQADFPETIIGHWLHIHPRHGRSALEEFRRCIGAAPGFAGLVVNGQVTGLPASDDAWDPFYRESADAGIPVLILVGHTAAGAGIAGGQSIILDHGHPRHVDAVAAGYPGLLVIAGRSAWPWQTEMIAVLLHKANVYQELHGWRPKYLPADLLREIPRRLHRKVMFGADYPMLSYDTLLADWKALGLEDELIADVLHDNASHILANLGQRWTSPAPPIGTMSATHTVRHRKET